MENAANNTAKRFGLILAEASPGTDMTSPDHLERRAQSFGRQLLRLGLLFKIA
jgi:hypothetical protein